MLEDEFKKRLKIRIVVFLFIILLYIGFSITEARIYTEGISGVSSIDIFSDFVFKDRIGVRFSDENGNIIFSIYRANQNSTIPTGFLNSMIFQTDNITNLDKMEICFWDNENQIMLFCLNEGGLTKATTIRRSFQVVGNVSLKPNDANFTVCEGSSFVDCNTDITGSDLFVQDDIEALGSLYSNEKLQIKNNSIPCDAENVGSISYEVDVTGNSAFWKCVYDGGVYDKSEMS